MKKYKMLLIPSVYVLAVVVMVLVTTMLISGIKSFVNSGNSFNYTLSDVFDGDVVPVMRENNEAIVRPYVSNNVKVGKYFYDYEADKTKQKESLILYENTYLQNTGVDYISDELFDVVSILDGEVIGIEENDIYGNVLTIKHNDNLITTYSNIDGILVNVGYKVSQGEIIAKSSSSKLDSTIKSTLHFEVEYKGELIDPENLYTLKVSDLEQ